MPKLEQAKKTQPVTSNDQFLKKYGSGPPPPNPYISEKPFSRAFGYTPYTPPPPYGTHSGHKQGNNDNNQRKPTELAQNAVMPRDIASLGKKDITPVLHHYGIPYREKGSHHLYPD